MAQPLVEIEDKPPMLTFSHEAVEDRHASNITGRTQYRDVIKVFVRAWGDAKCEVPFIVKGFGIEEKPVRKNRTFEVENWVEEEIEGVKEFVKKKEMKTEIVDSTEFIYTETQPWIDQLKQRLKHDRISQGYFDYCLRAFKRWEETGEIPIDGTPLKEWTMCPEAIKIRCLEIGINTVERLAEATDEAVQSMGMGGREANRKAKAFMETGADVGKAAARISTLEDDLGASQRRTDKAVEAVSVLQAKVAELTAMQEGAKGAA